MSKGGPKCTSNDSRPDEDKSKMPKDISKHSNPFSEEIKFKVYLVRYTEITLMSYEYESNVKSP